MCSSRPFKVLAVGFSILAFLVLAVPSAEALCGDCVYITVNPECVSPPPNFALCRIYYTREFFVVAGQIVVVYTQQCEAYQECAV